MSDYEVRYDARRGRVRVRATGLPAGTVQAAVFYRPANRLSFSPVRGGTVLVTGGAMVRYVDHYEYAAGLNGYYAVEAYNTLTPTTSGDVTEVGGPFPVTPPLSEGWIKFVAAPHLNRRVLVIGWSEIERKTRNAVYEIVGRETPIASTSVHSSRRFSVDLLTQTLAERDALDASLKAGQPAYLHLPATATLPSLYCVIGDYSFSKGKSARSQRSRFTVAVTEVLAPPLTIFGVADTWATVADEHASWTALGQDRATWREVVG